MMQPEGLPSSVSFDGLRMGQGFSGRRNENQNFELVSTPYVSYSHFLLSTHCGTGLAYSGFSCESKNLSTSSGNSIDGKDKLASSPDLCVQELQTSDQCSRTLSFYRGKDQ